MIRSKKLLSLLLEKQPLGIWGSGVVGMSALRFAQRHSISCTIFDDQPLSPEKRTTISELATKIYEPHEKELFLHNHSIILASPGIDVSYYSHLPITWTTEADLLHDLQECNLVGITGSVGKTSITTILGQILSETSLKSCVAGNIGAGILDIVDKPHDIIITELSSFQLEHSKQYAPDIAIWTNLHPNHLDRHKNMSAYMDAKYQILAQQTASKCATLPLELAEQIAQKYGRTDAHWYVVAQENNIIQYEWFRDSDYIVLYDYDHITISQNNRNIQRIPKNILPNITFIENWCMILAACHALKIDVSIIEKISSQLHIPDHRMSHVDTVKNIFFYNDSKSTTIASTRAAVHSLAEKHPIHLILGGTDKGVDRSDEIMHLTTRVASVHCFGVQAQSLGTACARVDIKCTIQENLTDAFTQAVACAQENDAILFSPSGASFDQYKNYQERGTHFKELVHRFKTNEL